MPDANLEVLKSEELSEFVQHFSNYVSLPAAQPSWSRLQLFVVPNRCKPRQKEPRSSSCHILLAGCDRRSRLDPGLVSPAGPDSLRSTAGTGATHVSLRCSPARAMQVSNVTIPPVGTASVHTKALTTRSMPAGQQGPQLPVQ